jgi:valyl-tRNA synthetase
MTLPKRYDPHISEPEIADWWQENGVYDFDRSGDAPIFSIDTPPPTVSGNLHMGHVYSYSHADFFARYRRMRGDNVYYPMGFDDNGLPTERLVEKRHGIHGLDSDRRTFIELCLAAGEEAAGSYRRLWESLGLSVDWRYTYRTIDARSQRLAQWSFIDLYRQGLVYRREAPAIWCPACRTAIAQADVDDLERDSTFYTLAFRLEDNETLPIATTRPELLPACVAIFIHPSDKRTAGLLGRQARVPLFGQSVPILADPAADPQKGTGIVMCCTYGDTTDVAWQRIHQLPIIQAIGPDGRMLSPAGAYAGLAVEDARRDIISAIEQAGDLLERAPVSQTVRVHERCDTPVEYILTRQWFVRLLEHKQAFLEAGERIEWRPAHMKNRYRQWVENLAWDWCISRRRQFGVPFPLWHCGKCGEVLLADETDLPVNPMEQAPAQRCPSCGAADFEPETDVMDTWATSSMSPQIAGGCFDDPSLYERLDTFSLRPQAHEIIRTWAFYTIVKSHFHFGKIPWETAAISGWALSPSGAAKISKSRGGGPVSPESAIAEFSADAVRYWAANTSLGKDATIDEERIQAGQKLVTKLWNVAGFCGRFLEGYTPPPPGEPLPTLTLADQWILQRTSTLGSRLTELWDLFDYANARSELEQFFWRDLADNYLEMAKQRLYAGGEPAEGARFTLYAVLLATLQYFAPLLPFVTEAIYRGLYDAERSIHRSMWPTPDPRLPANGEDLLSAGEALLDIATAVRRYKSERNMALSAELKELQIVAGDPRFAEILRDGEADLQSITRANRITLSAAPDLDLESLPVHALLQLRVRA